MPKRSLRKFLLGFVGAFVITLGISLFTATTAATNFYYSITDLGTLGGSYSDANAINDAGQVAGTSITSQNAQRAFLWQNSQMTELPTLGGINNIALDINNTAQIVGHSSTPSGYNHAVLWSNNMINDLGSPVGGEHSYAYGINNSGQVLGSSNSRGIFLWQNGKITNLLSDISYPRAINDAGLVVGSSTSISGTKHAVLWDNGTVTQLGTLGGKFSEAEDINNKGQVIGNSTTSTSDDGKLDSYGYHCFLWSGGTMTDISPRLEDHKSISCYARGINNNGKVVGTIVTGLGISSGGDSYPFVWHNGRLLGLNSLLPPNSGWKLTSAMDINNKGQIVGSGIFNGQRKAFLLTPIRVTN